MSSSSGAHVTEGKATIYFESEKGVFYNPPQIPNRDLSVLALGQFAKVWAAEREAKAAKKAAAIAKREADGIPTFDKAAAAADAGPSGSAGEGLRVLDVMTASGLRALRYTLEVPEVTQVVANDIDPKAVATLRENIRRNGLSEEAIVPSTGDAVAVMQAAKPPNGARFESVELDPYGTAAPFFDAAMGCVAEGGLLMVTCTDLAVLAGAYPEKCHSNYGSWPLKHKHCHESALRIVLACAEGHANRHKRYIVPLLSVHINFYVRLFVRVYTSPGEVKKAPTKLSKLYQCSGCESFVTAPIARTVQRNGHEKIVPGQLPDIARCCEHCGQPHHVGGPIWSAPMHDADFVKSLLGELNGEARAMASAGRLRGMLTSCLEELPDVPLFMQLAQMSGTLQVQTPTMVAMVSALLRQGYRVSRSHTDPGGIKTDAPNTALWDVMRCWAATHDDRKKPLGENTVASKILATQPAVQADFTPTKEAHELLRKRDEDNVKIGRYQPNPEEWGPGSKGISHTTLGKELGRDAVGSSSAPAAGEGAAAAAMAAAAASDATSAMLDKRARNQNKNADKKSRKRAALADGAKGEATEVEGGDQGTG